MKKDYRSENRKSWYREEDNNVTDKFLEIGAMLRIADALENISETYHPGMTLFESFVKAAMQGYCANPKMIVDYDTHPKIAEASIRQALATIEALEKHYEKEAKGVKPKSA